MMDGQVGRQMMGEQMMDRQIDDNRQMDRWRVGWNNGEGRERETERWKTLHTSIALAIEGPGSKGAPFATSTSGTEVRAVR